ncbi:hypothetical protein N0V93_001810 [Gnomoniopsis smithogilvyi]|uniref:SMP-30/Gluconolactonase/LRE-like region domain-containing protein n=1 Tax=Gnomoniopsis smithogilvyi TaxID=1191159 RepID=A0A9W9D208_9PEZI|nr:hypothetical protein N0V93_001810 [Gnomoniopsis smithogilvyi]
MKSTSLVSLAVGVALAQNTTDDLSPIVEACGAQGVVCVQRYATILPVPFFRNSTVTQPVITFREASVPGDASFSLLSNASFIVYDRDVGLPLLGTAPTNQFTFLVPSTVHEAPVYDPSTNRLYLSRVAPLVTNQFVVALDEEPLTLREWVVDPPLYAPNGATFFKGKAYFAVGGTNASLGVPERSGIREVDFATNTSRTVTNNYYGYSWNSPNDLVFDARGNIWFTDSQYAWFTRLTDIPPQLASNIYCFNTTTGETRVVDSGTLIQPNGLALSPDGTKMYVTDSGATNGIIDPRLNIPGTIFNQTGPRMVYKYDVIDGVHLGNRRAIFYSNEGNVDGIKVAENGLIVCATGKGVDVFDEYGHYIMRAQTNFTVNNLAFAGPDLKQLWMVGGGGVAKVTWDLAGLDLAAL